jgi:hypothetical protein
MGCLESMNYEVLLSRCSFQEARDYIKSMVKELHEVKPGHKLFDIHLIGVPPLYIGLDGDTLIFPFTKPCHGTFVVKVANAEEAARIRGMKKK